MEGVICTDPAQAGTLRLAQRRTGLDDLGYFDKFPAPMYEAMARLSPSGVINSTTPNYGPLLYTLGRAIGAMSVLEIGVAQGWSSGFMAWAVRENGVRHGVQGRYYGVDVAEKDDLRQRCDELQLPVEFIAHPKGSVDFLRQQKRWGPETFDLVFIDGWHNNTYVMQEMELIYPLVKGGGKGYVAMHDVYAYCEGVYKSITNDPRYEWESIRFFDNYGLALLRKMAGYDHDRIHWPEGDQPHAEGFTP